MWLQDVSRSPEDGSHTCRFLVWLNHIWVQVFGFFWRWWWHLQHRPNNCTRPPSRGSFRRIWSRTWSDLSHTAKSAKENFQSKLNICWWAFIQSLMADFRLFFLHVCGLRCCIMARRLQIRFPGLQIKPRTFLPVCVHMDSIQVPQLPSTGQSSAH